MKRLWEGDRATRVLETLFLIVMAVLMVQAFHKAYRTDGYDFTPRLAAARALVQGANPYQIPTPFPLTYPLFIAVALIPLAWLPYGFSNFLWFGLNAVCWGYSAYFLLGLFDPKASSGEFKRLFIACSLLLLPILQNNFVNGQVNFLVMGCCVLFLKFLLEKKNGLAGFFLAAGISLKLTPLIFLAFLFFRRSWAAMAWTLSFTFLFVWVLPFLIAGPAINGYYHGYLMDYVTPHLTSSQVNPLSESYNLSAYLRALAPGFPGAVLSLLAACLVLAPWAWLQAGPEARFSPRSESLLFSAYLLAILWISPISETHHLAFLFPAIFLLTRYYLWEVKGELWKRATPLAAIYILTWLGKTTFVFYFLAIGACYVLLIPLLRKAGSIPRKNRA